MIMSLAPTVDSGRGSRRLECIPRTACCCGTSNQPKCERPGSHGTDTQKCGEEAKINGLWFARNDEHGESLVWIAHVKRPSHSAS